MTLFTFSIFQIIKSLKSLNSKLHLKSSLKGIKLFAFYLIFQNHIVSLIILNLEELRFMEEVQ